MKSKLRKKHAPEKLDNDNNAKVFIWFIVDAAHFGYSSTRTYAWYVVYMFAQLKVSVLIIIIYGKEQIIIIILIRSAKMFYVSSSMLLKLKYNEMRLIIIKVYMGRFHIGLAIEWRFFRFLQFCLSLMITKKNKCLNSKILCNLNVIFKPLLKLFSNKKRKKHGASKLVFL